MQMILINMRVIHMKNIITLKLFAKTLLKLRQFQIAIY